MPLKAHELLLLASVGSRPPADWGDINSIRKLADGIIKVNCSGHGGTGITPERNLAIPESQRSTDCWYEEDIASALPLYTFQGDILAFRGEAPEKILAAANTIRQTMPDAWLALTGEQLDATSSAAIREAEFTKRHEYDWTVRSGFGYSANGSYMGVPEGMVGYLAYQSANTDRYGKPLYPKGFLVSAEEAKAVEARGYIIDLSKAAPVPGNTLGFGSYLPLGYTRLAAPVVLDIGGARKAVEGFVWKPEDGQLQIRLADQNPRNLDIIRTESFEGWAKLITDPDLENPADHLWYPAAAVALIEGHIPGVAQSTVQSTAAYLISRTLTSPTAQAEDSLSL